MYDLTMNSIGGEPVSLDRYRDQVCLIVNVASA
jgi:glutathione peroxidase-family protein